MLRRCGYDGRVTIIDAEPASPYDRPNLSKDYLAGQRAGGVDSAAARRILRASIGSTSCAAARPGSTSRRSRSRSRDAEAASYDALLLATGAEPVQLDMPGDDQPHVHYLRSLADSRAIIAAAKTAKRAVVIGVELHRARGQRRRCARGTSRCTSSRRRRCRSSACSATELGTFIKGAARRARRQLPSRSTRRSASRRTRWCSTTGRVSRRISS